MAKTVNLSYTRKTAPVRIDVVQYTTAPDIVFIIEDYTPTGRADIYIDKPSGEEIYNTCTIDGNKVIFTPTTQCFAEVGENKAQLQFLDGDKLAVSFLLTFVVQENIIDSSAAESQSEFTELQAAISTIGQYDQRITDVQNDMAELDTELTDDMAALQTNITNEMSTLNTELRTYVNESVGEIESQFDTITDNLQSLDEHAWQQLGYIDSSTDLADLLYANGYYQVTGPTYPSGTPYNKPYFLEILSRNGYTVQRATRVDTLGYTAIRVKKDGGDWGTWVEATYSKLGIGMFDSVTGSGIGNGYITSGSTSLILSLPVPDLPASLQISNECIRSLNVALRGVNGYLYIDGAAMGSSRKNVITDGYINTSTLDSGATFTVSKPNSNTIQIRIDNGSSPFTQSGGSAYSNNTPIIADFGITIEKRNTY